MSKLNKQMLPHRIIVVLLAIAALLALTLGTVLVFRMLKVDNSVSNPFLSSVIKSQAKELVDQARTARDNNNKTTAKELLNQAKKKYESINDAAGLIDIELLSASIDSYVEAPIIEAPVVNTN